MSPIRRLLRELARFADPGDEAVRRVERRLREGQADPEPVRRLLRELPEPDPWASKRVRARVQTSLATPRPALRMDGLSRPLGAALALAVVLLLVGRALRAPEPLDLDIDANGAPAPIALVRHVELVAEGRGHAGGDSRAPALRWDEGRLSVEVEPGQGIDLSVVTDEATVRVVGTGFDVQRSALGTRVAVRHGRVSVSCASGASALLGAAEEVECLPVRPPALLGRARALAAAGAPTAAVLSALDAADRPENPPALAGEILAARVDVLRDAGRAEEALTAASLYLERGYAPRRADVRRVAAALRFQQGGCEAALPLLRASVQEGGTPEDLAALNACEARDAQP